MPQERDKDGRGKMGRPPVQSAAVLDHLRSRILAGKLRPGAQIEKRAELEESLGVSQVTIQSVMNDLIADGFLHVRPSRGTFVTEHPPHLCHFGMVMPFAADDPAHTSRFYQALKEAAASIPSRPERRLSLYWGAMNRDHPDRVRLTHDIDRHRLAGLIFVGPVFHYRKTNLLGDPGLPKVAINVTAQEFGIPSVYPDFDRWLGMAVERVSQLGLRRVAMMGHVIDAENWMRKFLQQLEQYDLQSQPRLIQFHDSTVTRIGIRHQARTFWSGPLETRPQALLISDDNLVDDTLAGLADEGCRVGKDLHVMVHANFPAPKPTRPVDQLGFDVGELVVWSIDLLARFRKVQSVPSVTLLPPRLVPFDPDEV